MSGSQSVIGIRDLAEIGTAKNGENLRLTRVLTVHGNNPGCITFIQCRTNVEDVGPTLYKCYTNVLCSLGASILSYNRKGIIRCTIGVSLHPGNLPNPSPSQEVSVVITSPTPQEVGGVITFNRKKGYIGILSMSSFAVQKSQWLNKCLHDIQIYGPFSSSKVCYLNMLSGNGKHKKYWSSSFLFVHENNSRDKDWFFFVCVRLCFPCETATFYRHDVGSLRNHTFSSIRVCYSNMLKKGMVNTKNTDHEVRSKEPPENTIRPSKRRWDTMLDQCCASVDDAGPTLNQHWLNVCFCVVTYTWFHWHTSGECWPYPHLDGADGSIYVNGVSPRHKVNDDIDPLPLMLHLSYHKLPLPVKSGDAIKCRRVLGL